MPYQQLIPNDVTLSTLYNYPSNYQLMSAANPNFGVQLPQAYPVSYGPNPDIVSPGELGISGYGLLYDMVAPYITAAQNWWNGSPVTMPYQGQTDVAQQVMQQPTRDQQFFRDNWLGSQVQQIIDQDAAY